MLILFEHGTPKGLARALPGHTIITAQARGWDKLDSGALLIAEEGALDLLLTTDTPPFTVASQQLFHYSQAHGSTLESRP